jgi:hypothetical protein
MRVRILRVPPSRTLEGVDLTAYRFEQGRTYDVGDVVARVLVVWSYAERIGNAVRSDTDPVETGEFRRR